MHSMRLSAATGLLAAFLVFVPGPDSAFAQTAEQLQQLQQLTPAQRRAILDALDAPETSSQQELSQPEVVRPRESQPEPPDESDTDESEPADARSGEPDELIRMQDLEPFGYDLFAGEPTTFAPATDIPVPVDYVIGPGDTVELQLFGNENALYSLVVGRDGVLNVPEIGPVSVSGLKFSELTQTLQQRISEQMIGVRASITMGPLRSIRVFVLGDAYRPGSYTVSALSTMTNALFVSGGINEIGSLRNVQLKRNGQTVTTLDLYDLLLRGDTSGDARLQPGDVIFVPPVGNRVGIAGEVRRPAIYELRNERSIGDAVTLAGGMLPTAYPEASQVARINPDRERTVINVDLTNDAGLATPVRADDLVRVLSVLEESEDVVTLAGHAWRPGPYEWRPGMRISNLIGSLDAVRPKADLDYLMIRREHPETRDVSVVAASLVQALRAPGSPVDLPLQARDRVIVFNLEDDRGEIVEPIVEELRLQARRGQPAEEVRILGRVRAPGVYPLEPGMRVSDLVRAGGDLAESAYALEAELTRYETGADNVRETKITVVDLDAAIRGDLAANAALQPYDILTIKEIPQWRESEVVELIGEIRFPGSYPIRRGERLSSVLERAGGVTDQAFPDGAVFLRQSLAEREQEQLEELAERLESEVRSAAAAETEQVSDTQSSRLALLAQVQQTEATGRLVIDLSGIVDGSAPQTADVVLRDGDRLLVPRESQTVTIIGEVQFPTSHVYSADLSRDDYIDLSGGTNALADKKRIYVVRADGSVIASRKSLFFRPKDIRDIRPGDTIVVPLKPDPVSNLSLWTSVTTILYNIGVAAAAVASF